MKNLKVGTRILLSFSFILSLMAILTASFYLSNINIINNVDTVEVNNRFSVSANNLLEKFNAARAYANSFFAQIGDESYIETIDAIEKTQVALDELYEVMNTYPSQLSIYETELDAINDSIAVYKEAVENVAQKRERQNSLRNYILYLSIQVNGMFQRLFDELFSQLLADAARQTPQNGSGINISPNVDRLRQFHSLNDDFDDIISSLTSLLYLNDISQYDEIVLRLDDYYAEMSDTLQNHADGNMRAIAISAMSHLLTCRTSVSEYREAIVMSAESKENAHNAQSSLQSKTRMLLQTLENISRANIDETKTSASDTLMTMLLISTLALAAGLILTIVVTRSITQPVEKMVAAAHRLAIGDTDPELDISSSDEVGRLAKQMQEMIVSVKEREKALSFKSERDLLTGLFNKMTTSHLIDEFLVDGFSEDMQNTHALFFMDLDNFKPVNDTLGHDYGDKVLCDFADLLRSFFRSSDIIGRVGGDEFVVLAKNIPSIELAERRAAEACQALRLRYFEQGREFIVTTSIGVCFFSAWGSNFEELSKRADKAMYVAKNSEKGTYHLYT